MYGQPSPSRKRFSWDVANDGAARKKYFRDRTYERNSRRKALWRERGDWRALPFCVAFKMVSVAVFVFLAGVSLSFGSKNVPISGRKAHVCWTLPICMTLFCERCCRCEKRRSAFIDKAFCIEAFYLAGHDQLQGKTK